MTTPPVVPDPALVVLGADERVAEWVATWPAELRDRPLGRVVRSAAATCTVGTADGAVTAVVKGRIRRSGGVVAGDWVRLDGTARSLSEDVRVLVEERLRTLVENTAAAFGAKGKLTYRRNYPVLVNHERQTEFAGDVASEIAGAAQVDRELPPMMGAEDFSFMLNERPGAFIWIGNGPSAGLHHPEYNFNDEIIPFGTSYWVRLVETALEG